MTSRTSVSDPIVTIEGLNKKFKDYGVWGSYVLKDISLSIPRGSIIGLVGRNGAGKTTLLRHIVGLLLPTSGRVMTLGCPAMNLRAVELNRIGYLDQEPKLLATTIGGLLRYVASFYESWDRELQEYLVDLLEVKRWGHIGHLSVGEQQKAGLLLALCHRPELILLDEPLSALDPIIRERVLDYLLECLRNDNATIVISSHILRDIEKIADHLIFMENGEVKESGPIDELQERYTEWIVTRHGTEVLDLSTSFPEPFIVHQSHHGDHLRLIVRHGEESLEAFRERYLVEVMVRPMELEKVLLHLLESEAQ